MIEFLNHRRQIGFYGVFSIAACMHLFALFYGIFFVREPKIHMDKAEKMAATKGMPGGKSMVADFFDKDHVVETFKVAFKNGAKQRRLRVIMLIIVVMVVDGPLHGKHNMATNRIYN